MPLSVHHDTRPAVAVATCPEARGVDEDASLLLAALAAAGVDPSQQDWADPEVSWADFDLVVIRSTWDYAPRRDEFVAWARRVGAVTRLANPAPVIEWNTDKHYLADLAADRIDVVPTTFVEPGEHSGVDDVAARIAAAVPGDTGFVVKPAVSAGSKDTFRHPAPHSDPATIHRAAAQTLAILDSGRSVMLQPYLDTVDDVGETGLVFFGGAFSHAFRKGPMLHVGADAVDGLYAPEEIEPREPTEEQLAVASQTIDVTRRRCGTDLLYARVDLLDDADGRPVVLELELTEPSFFLTTDPGAASSAAAAIVAAATTAAAGR